MRYSRQETLKEIGKKGQLKLGKSTIAVVGIGALGTVSSELLARAGIGKLVLIDRDFVELSNLQRQSLFDESDIGKPKAAAAFEKLEKINSGIKIDFFNDDLDSNNIGILRNTDLVLDATDNLETRFLLNDCCIKSKKPMIYSAGVGTKGYIFNIIPNKTACLRCFLDNSQSIETCETSGVLSSLTHIVGSIAAKEALKITLGREFEENLLFIDAWNNDISKIKVNKKENCVCCVRNKFEFLLGKSTSRTIKLCGQDIWQIKAKDISKSQFNKIKTRLKKIGSVKDFGDCINFDDKITLFESGRALIKAKSEKEARTVYSKFVGN